MLKAMEAEPQEELVLSRKLSTGWGVEGAGERQIFREGTTT